MASADQSQRDAAVHDQRGERDGNHPALAHGDRMAKAIERFVEQAERDEHEQDAVDERGERARAAIAVGALRIGGSLRPQHGEPGNQQRRNVGKFMNGVAEQRDGMPEVAAGEFRRDQCEGRGHRSSEDAAAHRRAVMAVRVIVFAGVRVHGAYSTAGMREKYRGAADMRAAHYRRAMPIDLAFRGAYDEKTRRIREFPQSSAPGAEMPQEF